MAKFASAPSKYHAPQVEMAAMRFRRVELAAATICALSLALVSAATAADKQYPSFGKIERNDPRFDKLIPKEAKLEKLADGFDWSEGAVWDKKNGWLLFSDIPPNNVMK